MDNIIILSLIVKLEIVDIWYVCALGTESFVCAQAAEMTHGDLLLCMCIQMNQWQLSRWFMYIGDLKIRKLPVQKVLCVKFRTFPL